MRRPTDVQATFSMREAIRWALMGALALSLIGGQVACEASSLPARTTLDEPRFLTFRCVRAQDGEEVGLPVAGCGCSRRVIDENGEPQVEFLGRVACTCQAALIDDETGLVSITPVSSVDVDPDSCEPVFDGACQVGWSCDPVIDEETGDWQIASELPSEATEPGENGCPPVPIRPIVQACRPAGGGEVRAYVGATERGEVAVIDVGDDDRINDVDPTIPGSTAIFVDDVIADLAADPDGRFVMTVNSSTGSITVMTDDRSVLPDFNVSLGHGALLHAVVSPGLQLPVSEGRARLPRRAWISAPQARAVLELDLDALAAGETDPEAVIVQTIELSPAVAGEEAPQPGVLSVDRSARYLVVGHLGTSAISVVDLLDPQVQRVVPLTPGPCEDGYLRNVETDLATAGLCNDGLDNDGDGALDGDDPHCQAGLRWEGLPGDGADPLVVPACPVLLDCHDGADNDADGLIDEADPDCESEPRWEGPAPACANGEDDDGDGRVDRADPDCAHEEDPSEHGREVSTCADGLDNTDPMSRGTAGLADQDDPACRVEVSCVDGRDDDDDGLVDDLDPDCAQVETACANGEDDDGDGLVDLDDPQCAGRSAAGLPEETLASPCLDGLDNDGDGLTDDEDPGCRDFDAALKYTIERMPECGDGIDNDRDGLIDFGPEGFGDPDCFAAGDTAEGGLAITLGPIAVETPIVVVDDQAFRLAYALDRTTNDLYRVVLPETDLADATFQVRRLALGVDFQLVTSRTLEGSEVDGSGRFASLLTLDASGVLRPVEITGPQPLTDSGGRPLHARLSTSEPFSSNGVTLREVEFEESVYVEAEGQAWCAELCTPDAAEQARFKQSLEEIIREAAEVENPTDEAVGVTIVRVTFSSCDELSPVVTWVGHLTDDPDTVYTGIDSTVVESANGTQLSGDERQMAEEAYRVNAQARVGLMSPFNFDCNGTARGAIIGTLRAANDGADHVIDSNLTMDIPFEEGVEVEQVASEITSHVPGEVETPIGLALLDPDDPRASLDRGVTDPALHLAGGSRVLEEPANIAPGALSRTNRISDEPVFRLDGTTIRFDETRFPTFCQLDAAPSTGVLPTAPVADVEDACMDLPDEAITPAQCIPVGLDVDGTEAALSTSRRRTASRLSAFNGIDVLEQDPRRLPSDEFTLAYEGELPGSESRSGQFGERIDDGQWTLLDYGRDFCRIGVEPGDVILIDRLVPVTNELGEAEACVTLRNASAVEPLRYTVLEVTEHRLVLGPKTCESYPQQVARDERSASPERTFTAEAPLYQCAAQFIQYSVRVANDQWLLSGSRAGYRHPIVSQGGICMPDPARVAQGRVGRARLGETFENEFFRFRLGFLSEDDELRRAGVPDGRLPYQLEATFSFIVQAGRSTRETQVINGLAQEMTWLPFDDRLYIVDAVLGTLVEVAGVDAYADRFGFTRQFQ